MKRLLVCLLAIVALGLVGCEVEDDVIDVRLADQTQQVAVSVDQ